MKISRDDIDAVIRIEEKLDAIIKHFNINKKPRRSKQDLDQWAKRKVLDLNSRQKKDTGK